MDLCQNIAIITKQICNKRGDLSPLEGCNSKLAQLNVTALHVTVYLLTNQCSIFPNSLLIMESENFTQPSLPSPQLPTWSYHDSGDFCKFKEQSFTSFSCSKSHQCYDLLGYCSPSSPSTSQSHSAVCHFIVTKMITLKFCFVSLPQYV